MAKSTSSLQHLPDPKGTTVKGADGTSAYNSGQTPQPGKVDKPVGR